MRVERPRPADWTTRAVELVWRAYDLQLTTYALLLVAIGLAMAYSNSYGVDRTALDAGSTFLRGLAWAAIALVVFLVASAFDYRWLKTLVWPIYAALLGLLILTLAVGQGVGGSSRWVAVMGVQFQFSELAKIMMIVVLVGFLSRHRARLDSIWTILGACLLVLPPWVLVMAQPDLGTSLVFAAILIGTLFLAGASLRWLVVLGGGLVASLPLVWTHLLRDYQRERILSFLNPNLDIQGAGYQLHQSQVAVSSGGLFGRGLTNGTHTQGNVLPVQETDFVFTVLAEELGFIGGIVLFVLFALLLWRILVAGWRSRDSFGTMVACGLASMLLFQFVVNVGMVMGIMPITGIPLPFITHGGASLISLFFGLGILQSINVRQGRADW